MPNLRVEIHLGDNKFEIEGEFTLDAGFNTALTNWINAQGETIPGQLENITTQLEDQNTGLDAAVRRAEGAAPVE